jgi:hypothetical protein
MRYVYKLILYRLAMLEYFKGCTTFFKLTCHHLNKNYKYLSEKQYSSIIAELKWVILVNSVQILYEPC